MSHKSFRDALKEIVKTKHILIWRSIDGVELAAKRRKSWDETIWNENANKTSVFIPGKVTIKVVIFEKKWEIPQEVLRPQSICKCSNLG